MIASKAVPQTIIVLCERIDIAAVVDVYIKYLRTQGMEIPKVRIVNLQEIENLPQYLENLEQFAEPVNIAKVLVFADASKKRLERQYFITAALQRSFLRNLEYNFYLFPRKSEKGNWTPGFMEDLLLPALSQESSEECEFYNLHSITHEFLFSVQNCRGKGNRFVNASRNFLYSYLSGTEKFVGLRLGEAAAKGAFDLENEVFEDLRKFMNELIREV